MPDEGVRDAQYQHSGPVDTRRVVQPRPRLEPAVLAAARESAIATLRYYLPRAHPGDAPSIRDALASILAGNRWSLAELAALERRAERSAQRDKTPLTLAQAGRDREDLYGRTR